MSHREIIDDLLADLAPLTFAAPVTHVYNPLEYARRAYETYLERYGSGRPETMLLGMNPGPWGMAQTGIPFGEVAAVTGWMQIRVPVDRPAAEHPKRPVEGPDCPRSEVSGRRLWGWARDRFGSPRDFFRRFFVANYCPLVFMEAGGRNRTPNTLPAAERRPLETACDRALRRTVELLAPRRVMGVGVFAARRAASALEGSGVTVGRITHPSPANPRANRGWARQVTDELRAQGVDC